MPSLRKPVTFGLAGTGMAAQIHAKALAQTENAALAAVYDNNPSRGAAFAAEWNLRGFSSWEAFLADDTIDVICLCTPSGLHADQAEAALRAGRHVLVEKPLALHPADCDRIISTAKQTGKHCGVVSQLRFAPAITAVKAAVVRGDFGRIVGGEVSMPYHRPASYFAESSWRGTWAMDGGGALINQGIHGVDVLLHWMGKPVAVGAFCKTLTHAIKTEDTAVAAVSFESGAIGTVLAATSLSPGYPRRFSLFGSKGSVLLEEDRVLRWDLPSDPPEITASGQGGHKIASAIAVYGHKCHMEEMVQAVSQNIPPTVDAQEGKKAVHLIHSIYQSAQSGQIIQMEEEK